MRKFLAALLLCCFSCAGSASYAQAPMLPIGGTPSDNLPLSGPSGSSGLQSCSAACNGTTLLGPIDTTGYGGINIQITTIGGGATLAFQGSDDPVCSTATNWASVGQQSDSTQQASGSGLVGGYVVSTTQASNYRLQTSTHCFRLQFTAYTSGTVSAQGVLRSVGGGPVAVFGAVTPLNGVYCTFPGNCTTSGTVSSSTTPITASATGTTASIAITLPGTSSHTTYICGFTLSADATAATEGAATITGTVTGTLNFRQSIGALSAGTAQTQQTFTPCIPASAANTAIVVNSAAAGAGGNAAGYAWGFQL